MKAFFFGHLANKIPLLIKLPSQNDLKKLQTHLRFMDYLFFGYAACVPSPMLILCIIPCFVPQIRWLGTYDVNTRKVAAIGGTAAFADI